MHVANSYQIFKKIKENIELRRRKCKSQLSSYVTSLFLGKVRDNRLWQSFIEITFKKLLLYILFYIYVCAIPIVLTMLYAKSLDSMTSAPS
jgi:hypothetical protein